MPSRPPRYPTYALRQLSVHAPELNAWRFGPDAPLRQIGVHSNQFLSVLLFEHGTGTHRLGQRDLAIQPGTVVLVPPAAPQSWDAIDDGAGWLTFFTPELLHTQPEASFFFWRSNPLLYPFTNTSPHAGAAFSLAPDAVPAWAAHMRAIRDEIRHRQVGSAEAARAHLLLLLVEIARLASNVVAQFERREQRLLAAVFAYIEHHYHKPISLADVAAALGLTPGYLTTAVRAATGRTVLQWIVERRMAEARTLLSASDDSIETISARVGYTDPTYFTRQFRRMHAASPQSWRTGLR